MPVAKSYQGLEIVKGEHKVNGRSYVIIKTKSGGLKQVRWYSDVEYAKMYPEVKVDKSKELGYKSQKIVLGFEKGYVTIFRGIKEEHEEWFKQSPCRFCRYWGWYLPSTFKELKDLPFGVEPVRLDWDPMDNGQEWLKKENEVKKYVRSVLMKKNVKEIKTNANIGDRLDINIKIISRIEDWGNTFEYKMKDSNENYYKWKTSAKDWDVGTEHRIRGTVKDFDAVDGIPATVLTRCLEVKG